MVRKLNSLRNEVATDEAIFCDGRVIVYSEQNLSE